MSGHSHGCCEPHNDGIFGNKTELIFAIISGIFLLIGFLVDTLSQLSFLIVLVPYLISYGFGGYFTLMDAIKGISKGKFKIDFLMLVAAIGAAFLDKWAEGALLLFLFSLGHALEHLAMEKARKSIEGLTKLSPKIAFRKEGNKYVEVGIEKLKVGDIIQIKPNSTVSADGIITAGGTSIN